MNIKIKRLPHCYAVPTQATPESAGMDLYACDTVLVESGGIMPMATGISLQIPVGYEGQVRPRSGLAIQRGVTVLNSPGTVDADYRGEVVVALINHGSERVRIRRGDRIAQLVIAPTIVPSLDAVDDLDDTERGGGGFGSTGQ